MKQEHWYVARGLTQNVAFVIVFWMVRCTLSPASLLCGERRSPSFVTDDNGQTLSAATTLRRGFREATGATTYPRILRVATQARIHHWAPSLDRAEAETQALGKAGGQQILKSPKGRQVTMVKGARGRAVNAVRKLYYSESRGAEEMARWGKGMSQP